jgi:hypothetical protein
MYDEQVYSNLHHDLSAKAVTELHDDSPTVEFVKTHDWYNGFYLHVSGPRAKELLPLLYENTYTINIAQPTPVTIRRGAAMCPEYTTSFGEPPQFPHMPHMAYSFAPLGLLYDGVTCIPLLLNTYGSDLAVGFPNIAVMFTRLTINFTWCNSIAQAIQRKELVVNVVVQECGFVEGAVREDHAMRRHEKDISVVDAIGNVRTQKMILKDGCMVVNSPPLLSLFS